jgi:hypothetical protein
MNRPGSMRTILLAAGVGWMFAGWCLTAEVIEKSANVAGIKRRFDPFEEARHGCEK